MPGLKIKLYRSKYVMIPQKQEQGKLKAKCEQMLGLKIKRYPKQDYPKQVRLNDLSEGVVCVRRPNCLLPNKDRLWQIQFEPKTSSNTYASTRDGSPPCLEILDRGALGKQCSLPKRLAKNSSLTIASGSR